MAQTPLINKIICTCGYTVINNTDNNDILDTFESHVFRQHLTKHIEYEIIPVEEKEFDN